MKLSTAVVFASAVTLAAATVNAGEIRITDAAMDSVTAGQTLIVVQEGPGRQGGDVDFGQFGFEPIRLGGETNPLEPPPPEPAFGGFDLQGLLGNLLSGLFGL